MDSKKRDMTDKTKMDGREKVRRVTSVELDAIMETYHMKQREYEQMVARADLKTAKEAKRERKSDTRRKIIVGGTILAMLRDGSPLSAQVIEELNWRVSALRDREVVREMVPIDPIAPQVVRGA